MPWRFGSSSVDATVALNFGVLSSVLRRQIVSIIVLFSAQTFWENEGTTKYERASWWYSGQAKPAKHPANTVQVS